MNNQDFKELEKLLDKLMTHIGYNYCIVPNHVHDGYYVGLYNKEGNLFATGAWASLQEATRKAMVDASKIV